MNLELHILQNFAPSNLNRDDTGSPKSCEFGGVRRARISSQCLKRAIREQFKSQDLVPAANRAERTKRLVLAITEGLQERGRDAGVARGVAEQALAAIEIKLGDLPKGEDATLDEYKTQYLVYLGATELATLVSFCDTHWTALEELASPSEAKGKAKDKKASSKDIADKLGGKSVVEALKKSLDGGRAADLALFGRMLADLPERNIDAASQVAHAISTHQVGIEFDYYTAVDDRKPDDNAGADMIGTVEFNSACYYRYANIDLGQLFENLGKDRDLALKTVEAFLLANRDAEPTGKQNSFAARNKPSFVFAVVRGSGSWSLANAFAVPVRGEDLVGGSIDALAKHWDEMVGMYDAPDGLAAAWCALGDHPDGLLPGRVANYRAMVAKVLEAVAPSLGTA